MFKFDYSAKEHIKEHNINWSQIPDYPYRILIAEGSGSGKPNALLNLLIKFISLLKIYINPRVNY